MTVKCITFLFNFGVVKTQGIEELDHVGLQTPSHYIYVPFLCDVTTLFFIELHLLSFRYDLLLPNQKYRWLNDHLLNDLETLDKTYSCVTTYFWFILFTMYSYLHCLYRVQPPAMIYHHRHSYIHNTTRNRHTSLNIVFVLRMCDIIGYCVIL